jgi:hypothetical protein
MSPAGDLGLRTEAPTPAALPPNAASPTTKDPATNDITRGWCRLMSLTPLMLFTTTLLIVRNQRILHAWNTRQEENARRAAKREHNPHRNVKTSQ